MGTDPIIAPQCDSHRYEAVVRISEAIAACREPEELATTLASEIAKFLHFDHLYFVVVKENSEEIEYLVWGKGPLPLPDLPMEELPWWEAVHSRDPQHTDDWDTEERYPRFKEWAKKIGLGSGVRVPLTTPHRRLGVFGVNRDTVNPFSEEEISFLELIGRVVAFALDDGLNLRRAQHQNDQLQLLLDLTNRITSNLRPRDLLRAIAANIREVIHADAVTVVLPDAASEKFRVLAMDFPHGKGVVKEELLITPSPAVMKALDTLKPVVTNTWEPNELSSDASDLVAAEGIKTFCNIPLVNRGRALGILSILRTTETPFSPGDIDFLSRASGQIAIAIENALAYREISELKDKLAEEKLYLEEEIRSEMNFENIIGNSPALKHVLELVETVAPSDSTVLLLGETGTGKELIARAIHDRSRRKDRTFVKLNCAAIPTGLLESELFGHEKGAFTGAITHKTGRMELADQGTLFLDEVGDIPVEIQPKLLRAIQEREFERLGSIHTRRVNIRLVAATNRDLEKMIADREFRSDLYYRLHVFPIRIPPLRERKGDIPQLVSYFVQKFAMQMQKKIEAISPAVMKGLMAWEWPGNIRELENFMERAVIVTRGRSLDAPLGELRKTNTVELPRAHDRKLERVIEERTDWQSDQTTVADEYERRQRDEIVRALTACKGRVGGADGAATRLGMNRTTFLSRMKKFGIYAKQYA
ncbi:MAG TPA: sigma 54-interacting transcriptional regulator [Terriglobales bacterium]|jgi:formate hydrogenlyase transcriptional activator|nr:sigma 54-interacting transcriptional regulator [Terriglobales bacterium]